MRGPRVGTRTLTLAMIRTVVRSSRRLVSPPTNAARMGAKVVGMVLVGAAVAVMPAGAGAQVRPDSARADSLARQLPPVTVTGEGQAMESTPWAVGEVGVDELRRAQPTIGLDEALTWIPGVFVGNRYNFALDQRVSIRGFGSRANFGVRGVVVLLDGIPQTLADGQSQLTNVELGALSRVEVLRGSASSLYGNGAGGVLSFVTDMDAPHRFSPSIRVEGGSYGMLKWRAGATGRQGRGVGAVSLSRLTWDGPRPHGEAEVRQLNLAGDYSLSPGTIAAVRLNVSDVPTALNPGALTAAEFESRPYSAAPNNVLRRADKRVRQQQLSLRLRHEDSAGWSWDASISGVGRDLRNALASAPPGATSPEQGTYIEIDRLAGSARLAASRRLGGDAERYPLLSLGAQWQGMRDDRTNQRATAGRPTQPGDDLLLDQRETVWSLGPFAQLSWNPLPELSVSSGVRHDQIRFGVADHFLSDGDDGGGRTLRAWSGHLGASYTTGAGFVPYANVSTSFETPTTVELQPRADEGGGFNPALGPQRALTVEVGARGTLGAGRVTYSAALFDTRVRDAIVQYQEMGGRAHYRNAGQTRNDGVEVGVDAQLHPALGVMAAYTWAHYRFGDYAVGSGGSSVVLDGRRLPGVPEHFLRVGARTSLPGGAVVEVDQSMSSAVWADDANTIRVEGWGAGITRARASWSGRWGSVALQPFVGVENLLDRAYVSTVVVNGFGGRVREPGAGLSWYFGMEVGR